MGDTIILMENLKKYHKKNIMPKVRKCSKQTKIKTNPTMIKVFKGTQKRSERVPSGQS